MRFVWAVAAFVLAAVMIGAGIAQRTVFQGPTTETATISVEEDAPYLLIDGAVFNTAPGAQTLRAYGEGEIFASYGRTADMEAWLADADYNAATVADDGAITTTLMVPEAPDESEAGETTEDPADETAEEAPAEEGDPEATVGRDPAGSDLWLDEFEQTDILIAPLQLPEGMSVLVATDGTAPAPDRVSVSWPIASPTPWAGPLIALGAILMAVGVFLYILAIRHVRRARGPRRKGLPLPVTEPIDLAVEQEGKGVISSTPSRRSIADGKGRRAFAVIPVVAVSALLFTGCTADAWPQLGSTPTPTPTATVIVPEGQQQPAVTKAQAERILTRVSTRAAEADEARDIDMADDRLSGATLEVRNTNYVLRGELDDYESPDPVLSKPLEIILPQAYDEWPRSFLAVVDDEETKTSSIMVLTQDDPWSEYRLSYTARLEASTLMPDLAAYYIGASLVAPDSPFLIMPPDEVAAAYADVINNGDESEYASLFDAEGDQLRVNIAADRERRLADFEKTGKDTGDLTFSTEAGPNEPWAIATLESGAIVAVDIHEIDTATPTEEGAAIKLPENKTVEALTGVSESLTGFTTTYKDQVFFYVPGQGSNEKIRLLGYSSDILNAKVIK